MAKTPPPALGAETRKASNERSPNRKPRTRSLVPLAEKPVRANSLRKRGANLVTHAEMDGFKEKIAKRVAELLRDDVAKGLEQKFLVDGTKFYKALAKLRDAKAPDFRAVAYGLDRIMGKGGGDEEMAEALVGLISLARLAARAGSDPIEAEFRALREGRVNDNGANS